MYYPAGFHFNSSTYSSRCNYVRVNAKRTYILLVHRGASLVHCTYILALRGQVTSPTRGTYLLCERRAAVPRVLTASIATAI